MENVTQSGKIEANSTYSTPIRSRQVGISETTPKKKKPVNKDLPVPPDRTPTSALRRGILKPISNVSSNKTPSNIPSVTFNEPKSQKRDQNSGLIKAYLRIRPINSENVIKPYIQIINDTEVVMIPPKDSHAFKTCNKGPEKYMFTKVFDERTSQKRFFLETTLPLVKGVLDGTNGLVFAYGVTNSGKTYSIQGTRNEEGILPRTLDTIFNSIKNLEKNYNGNETIVPPIIISKSHMENPFILSDSNSSSNKSNSAEIEDSDALDLKQKLDNIAVDVDKQFRYAVWVSYVEIYNEKIYDLLEEPGSAKQPESKRKALIVKNDKRTGNKYLSDIKEEGYSVLKQGMKNRQIFSTLANETSSRSHCIFMIKIIKIPCDKDTATELSSSFVVTSRLSIVDLAGSERTKHVQTTGQCLEILRANQSRQKGQKHILVPYRHSKLTELFQSSFADGESVMIVNINPVDTGFDENMQVMKFSAVAKDVCTSLKNISSHYGYRGTLLFTPVKVGKENKTCENSDSRSEENYDAFINMLFTHIEDLREKWISAETRCGNLKLEIREQVSDELAVHMSNIGKKYMDQATESMERQMEIIRRDTPSTLHSGVSYYRFSSNLVDKLQNEIVELENEVDNLENKLKICASLLNDKDALIEKLQFENKELERQVLYIAQKLDYVDIETEDDSNLTDQELNTVNINEPSEETSLKEVENYNYISPTKQECDDRVGISLFEDNDRLYDIIEECDEEVKSNVSDLSMAIYEPALHEEQFADVQIDAVIGRSEEYKVEQNKSMALVLYRPVLTITDIDMDSNISTRSSFDTECRAVDSQKRTLDEINFQKGEDPPRKKRKLRNKKTYFETEIEENLNK
ncbi:108_t:CDS:10, partial [Dentiscutata heterogama]